MPSVVGDDNFYCVPCTALECADGCNVIRSLRIQILIYKRIRMWVDGTDALWLVYASIHGIGWDWVCCAIFPNNAWKFWLIRFTSFGPPFVFLTRDTSVKGCKRTRFTRYPTLWFLPPFPHHFITKYWTLNESARFASVEAHPNIRFMSSGYSFNSRSFGSLRLIWLIKRAQTKCRFEDKVVCHRLPSAHKCNSHKICLRRLNDVASHWIWNCASIFLQSHSIVVE